MPFSIFLWRFIQVVACINSTFLFMCMLSCFRLVWLWDPMACQAPLSTGFSRQEYWSGLPCPPLGDLPNPGIKPASLLHLLHWKPGSLPLVPPNNIPHHGYNTVGKASGILKFPLVFLNIFCFFNEYFYFFAETLLFSLLSSMFIIAYWSIWWWLH